MPPLWVAQVSTSPPIANPYPVLPAQTRSKPKEPNSFLVFVAELHRCFQQKNYITEEGIGNSISILSSDFAVIYSLMHSVQWLESR